MSELIMGLAGIPLKDLTDKELNNLVNSCIDELNIRELDSQKLDISVGDCFIDNTKQHRKGIYIIKKIDKRNCYTIIEGMRYTIEYDNLDIIGGERFALKTDILKNLQKLENFDCSKFESELNDIKTTLIIQWNKYIDALNKQIGCEIKHFNELNYIKA